MRISDWSSDVCSSDLVGFTTDGKPAYLLESRDRNTTALYGVDMDSGEKTLVFENPRADVDDALADPRTGVVQAAASNYLREEWMVIDDAIDADMAKLDAIGPGEAPRSEGRSVGKGRDSPGRCRGETDH